MNFDNAVASVGNDGALLLESGGMGGVDYGIESWSHGLTAYVNEDGFWKKCTGNTNFVFISCGNGTDAELAMRRFISDIPDDVCNAVREISYLQFPLLQAAANSRYFHDLLISTPYLAWILVDHALELGWRIGKIDKISRFKQVEILKIVIGVGEKSYIRFLRSIKLRIGNEYEFKIIRNAMRPDIKHTLQHENMVSVNLLEALLKYEVFIGSRFIYSLKPFSFERIELLKYAKVLARIFNDTLRLGTELKVNDAEKKLKACKLENQVHNLHERWSARFNNTYTGAVDDIKFPDPPILDTPIIIAIRRYADLIDEGREMEHCVGIMCDEVISGESYIYRVLQPQRATLQITRFINNSDIFYKCWSDFGLDIEECPSGDWEVEEFRLKKNEYPSAESWNTVEKWIDNYYGETCQLFDPDVYRRVKWGA